MTEVEYVICKVIKEYHNKFDKNPRSTEISRILYYSNRTIRYHLDKLQKVGIVEKTKDKKYRLIVNNLK